MEQSRGPGGELTADLRSQVFDAFPDAVVLMDTSGRVVDCNRAAETMFGRSRAELAGVLSHQVGLPDEADLRTIERDGAWSGEVPLPSVPDGVAVALVIALRDATGQVAGYARIKRDVTAERATAARLERAEKLWRTMLEVAPTGLALVSLEGRFQRVNRALCRILGYSADQLLGMTFQEVTHPDDLAGDLGLVHRLLGGEIDQYSLEKRYVHAHGYPVWVQLSVTVMRDGDTGRPEQFVAAVENVTARRQAGQRLSAIIAGASDAVVGIAPAGYVTEWNAAAERMFGYSRAEAYGRELSSLIVPPEQRPAHLEGLRRGREGEQPRLPGRPTEVDAL
ncbi:PAS domain S-box protein, partial [Kineosporia rhizophila]|uniref:PAS domain-containing protein n=1 Tax=Kineosporia rhizophila TaxID=84633 RepID=UPI001E4A1DB4